MKNRIWNGIGTVILTVLNMHIKNVDKEVENPEK